jgi:peptidoglycan-N-acetylglucosamine deacetylase
LARSLESLPWPGSADVAVSLTFDVDAECGWLGEGEQYARRLTTLSEGRFSVIRGLPRILDVLRAAEVPATFYVPGDTAERHTARLGRIVEEGHEVGHHGHLHLRSDRIDVAAQREEIERGLDALGRCLGVRANGYRSASWELTPETFELLLEFGFDYDSSCMGDDRPYVEEYDGLEILELPVHWALDDWPHFAWTVDAGGAIMTQDAVLSIWLAEFESALSDRRHVTYTMHPEVIGRGSRIGLLPRLIDEFRVRANVWFATHADVAAHVRTASSR